MQAQAFEYQDGATTFQGFYAFDEQVRSPKLKPIILICHDWSGCNQLVRQKAKELAALGYLGFALDMYGKGKLGKTKEEKSALMTPLINDRHLLQGRVLAAKSAAQTLAAGDPNAVAVMGYCFGGLCALDLARSGTALRAAVSLHGNLSAPEEATPASIKAKVLVLHGYQDPLVPLEQVRGFTEEMAAAKVDWQLHVYGSAMHAFANPEANDAAFGTLYNPSADQRSWRLVKDFFAEVFPETR